ncbi:MAG: hypothetical protein ACRD22_15565 [Terriglobia bacterium]
MAIDPLGALKAATPGANAGGQSTSNPGAQARPPVLATLTGRTEPTPAGGANAVAAPQGALAQDPAYLAYMRAIGISNANDTATAQKQINAQNSALATQIPLLVNDNQFASQNALGKLEARGILEGGGAANEMAQLQARQQANVSRQQANEAAKVAAINQTLQAQQLANQVKLTEHGLTTAGKLGTSIGEQQISNAANKVGGSAIAAAAGA